ADRIGRRKTLIFFALTDAVAGGLLLTSTGWWAPALAGIVGNMTVGAGEVGPFLSLEQAMLPQTSRSDRRTLAFSAYNLIGYGASSQGRSWRAFRGTSDIRRCSWATWSPAFSEPSSISPCPIGWSRIRVAPRGAPCFRVPVAEPCSNYHPCLRWTPSAAGSSDRASSRTTSISDSDSIWQRWGSSSSRRKLSPPLPFWFRNGLHGGSDSLGRWSSPTSLRTYC